MGRRKKLRKEEIAEDWCFVCKDGGTLMVCEYKDCLKAYHADCVGKDDAFLKTGNYMRCGWHNCFLCRKTSKFQCFCCTTAVCGRCFCDADFSIVRGNKGFCSHCLRLARLVEENADADSDGGKIDFKDPETYEFLFSDYYKIIKEKERWRTDQVLSAHNSFKNGKNYKFDGDLYEVGEGEDDTEESEDNFVASDYDDLKDTAAFKPVQKRKSHTRELKPIKGKVKAKKKEFIGWGTRSLFEFLEYTGRDTNKVLSQFDVTSIIVEYCKENNLFDPKKKKKVLCDSRLKCLLGRKTVNRNSIFNLLTSHFADNVEETEDDIISSSEDGDEIMSVKCRKQTKLSSSTASHEDLVSEAHESCFAAIVTENIKLVYLKRSLIEELLTQPDTFDGKVIGSFVRVKSDPNDYLQKNSYLLLQVAGITRPSGNDEIKNEILLHFSNVPRDVPICKVSDDNFSEEECQDLHQRMKDGLLPQPTVLELEQKARSLHEDIMKHWIPREVELLQRRIDHANEKGWRRELDEYINKKELLQSQSEQSRLLNQSPKVIPEIVHMKPSQEREESPSKDKLQQNRLPELVLEEASRPPSKYSKVNISSSNNRTNSEGLPSFLVSPISPEIVHMKPSKEREEFPSKDKLQQNGLPELVLEEASRPPRKYSKVNISSLNNRTDSAGLAPKTTAVRNKDGRKISASVEQSPVTVIDLEEDTPPSKQIQSTSKEINLVDSNSVLCVDLELEPMKCFSTSKSGRLKLMRTAHSGSGDEDANVKVQQQAGENPETSIIWHCVGPQGERRGPFSLSLLKRWSETSPYSSRFKIWKTGQNETEAILLPDALRQWLP